MAEQPPLDCMHVGEMGMGHGINTLAVEKVAGPLFESLTWIHKYDQRVCVQRGQRSSGKDGLLITLEMKREFGQKSVWPLGF